MFISKAITASAFLQFSQVFTQIEILQQQQKWNFSISMDIEYDNEKFRY